MMKYSFYLLGHRVTVETGDPALKERLEDITVHSADAEPISTEIILQLRSLNGLIQIVRRGSVLAQASQPDIVIRDLHMFINDLVLEARTDLLKLHAGAATWEGHYFLVTGDRGAGKTTLLLKMMLNGTDVHCDEIVLLEEGMVRTFLRKFHIRAGTLTLLPRVAEVCKTKHSYPDYSSGRFFFADPTDFGLAWHSRKSLPQAIFHLHSPFNKTPRMETCTKVDMAKHLLCQTINLTGDLGWHVQKICHLIEDCRCFSLRVGMLDQTAELVKEALA